MLRLLVFMAMIGGMPAATVDKPTPEFQIVVPPIRPKTFFERTFPHAEPPWPSNRTPMQTPWRKTPLQVV